MAEDITHPGHNPFDAPRKKRNNGVTAAIIGSVVVHGVVGVYLWKAKFQSEFKEYSDEVTDVAIIKPAPPPPTPTSTGTTPQTASIPPTPSGSSSPSTPSGAPPGTARSPTPCAAVSACT